MDLNEPFTTLNLVIFLCGNFTLWLVVYIKKTITYGKDGFTKDTFWHTFHAFGLLVLSCMSLYFDDDTICPELVPAFFTIPYFVIELLDCVVRKDVPFTVHAVCSLTATIFVVRDPTHLSLRAVSCGGLTELSNFPGHRWRRTKEKRDFVIFAIVFTLCRVLWIPYFLPSIYIQVGLTIPVLACGGLFVLNFVWWCKIIHIWLHYGERSSKQIIANLEGSSTSDPNTKKER